MKQKLQKYYDGWKKRLLACAIAAWLGYYVLFLLIKDIFAIPVDASNKELLELFISSCLGFIAPNAIIIWGYFKIMDYIDKEGWKKKFPGFDFSGTWVDNTTYNYFFDETGFHKNTKTESMIPAEVKIKQTCRTVEIDVSSGDDFEWRSIAADWDESNHLNILYRVDYRDSLIRKQKYPPFRYGYEKVHVFGTTSANSKPEQMRGKFWHCVSEDQKPMFYGEVEYLRKPQS